ncbi:MAG: sugar-binding domain-containing protein [Actinomycetota bacterium]
MTDSSTRNDLAVRVAWLYHERGLTQQDIADRLGISRSTISRVLTEAERDGIIRVVITQPLPESARLAEALIERYGLSGAIVGPKLDDEPPALAAAAVMARRLESIAASGSVTIAAGWGRTIALSAGEVRPVPTSGVVVVDAFGHTTTDDTTAAVEVTNVLSRKFDAKVMHVPSPGFADSEELARTFLSSRPIARALDTAKAADVAIVSIGITGPESLLVAEGFMTREAMDQAIEDGAVGEIFGWYFDAEGASVSVESLHPIAMTLEDLREASRVIGVAGGPEKAEAIKGAIATGILDELAVDESLAEALLSD